MIVVRTKGVPLAKELRKDDEGFDVFALDDTKFDPLQIALLTLAKCGYPNIGGGDPKLDALQKRWRDQARDDALNPLIRKDRR